jgi:hypothetical protein
MNVAGNAANLMQALKDLRLEWEQTQAYWRDVKSEEFSRKYLEQLPNDVSRTALVIKEIGELLNKVRGDCE